MPTEKHYHKLKQISFHLIKNVVIYDNRKSEIYYLKNKTFVYVINLK